MDRPSRSRLAHLPALRDSPIVFLTTVTYARRPVLASPIAHDRLREIWQRSADCDGWLVGHYVVMPDHVHLFAMAHSGSGPVTLSRWVKMWKSLSARSIKPTIGPGPLWQRDYFDRYLRSEESYVQKWQYVRDNPVRAGLVETADAWPYGGTIHELDW